MLLSMNPSEPIFRHHHQFSHSTRHSPSEPPTSYLSGPGFPSITSSTSASASATLDSFTASPSASRPGGHDGYHSPVNPSRVHHSSQRDSSGSPRMNDNHPVDSPDLVHSLLPPGSAALLDLIDKRVLVILRDGRMLVGILRSYDQFANLVFQDTVERITARDVYGDIDRGVFVVRGENVVLLGQVDGDVEDSLPVREVPVEDALTLQRMDLDDRRAREAIQRTVLHHAGFCVDFDPNDMY